MALQLQEEAGGQGLLAAGRCLVLVAVLLVVLLERRADLQQQGQHLAGGHQQAQRLQEGRLGLVAVVVWQEVQAGCRVRVQGVMLSSTCQKHRPVGVCLVAGSGVKAQPLLLAVLCMQKETISIVG